MSHTGDPKVEALEGAQRWTFPATPPLRRTTRWSTPAVLRAAPGGGRSGSGPVLHVARWRGSWTGTRGDLHPDRAGAGVLRRTCFEMPSRSGSSTRCFMPEYGGRWRTTAADVVGLVPVPQSATPAESDQRAQYLLHEVAHMWFGQHRDDALVDDLWLNEAIRRIRQLLGGVRATSHPTRWPATWCGGKLGAYLLDQGPARIPSGTGARHRRGGIGISTRSPIPRVRRCCFS